MAQWKKIITSGSSAELSSLSLDTALSVSNGGTGQTAASASGFLIGADSTTYTIVGSNGSGQVVRSIGADGVQITGSFTGSFKGDGSGLSGILTDSTFSVYGNDGSQMTFGTATDIIKFNTASSHGFGFTTSETSNTASVILQTPQDLKSTADVTFGSVTTTGNIVVGGDFTVNGSVINQNVENISIEDKFILLNSGSSTGDGGIIIQTETTFSGSALGWDDSATRWGVQANSPLSPFATSFSPEAFISQVIDVDAGMSDISFYQKNGNIKIDSGEIFIYA